METELCELIERIFPLKLISQGDRASKLLVIQTPMGERKFTIKNDAGSDRLGLEEAYEWFKVEERATYEYLLKRWRDRIESK